MPRLSRYGGDSSWIVGCSEVDRVAELSCCKIAKSYAIQAELPRSGSVTDCPVFASWVNFRIARQNEAAGAADAAAWVGPAFVIFALR